MHAVASCDGLCQPSVNVGEGDGETVVLHLAAYLEGFAGETTLDAVVPLTHLLFRVGVGQREHGVTMRYLTEARLQVAAYALGGRVGVVELGVACLEVL